MKSEDRFRKSAKNGLKDRNTNQIQKRQSANYTFYLLDQSGDYLTEKRAI